MDNEIVVGIDLGTTNSGVACFIDGKLKMIENTEGDNTTASYVFFTDEKNVLVGKNAKRIAVKKPEHGIYGIKRLMGRQYNEVAHNLNYLPFKVKNESGEPRVFMEEYDIYKTPEEISAYILQKLKNDVCVKLNTNVSKAIITVPAHFNISQRKATLKAAEEAGFTVLKLLNEPTAAALNYFYDRGRASKKKTYSLVYDLGGGTFDVAVLEQSEQAINIICIDGDSSLGGHDFDNLIAEYICDKIKKDYNFNVSLNNRKLRRLVSLCIEAKEDLSTSTETFVQIDSLFDDNDSSVTVSLTRAQFEEKAMHCFKHTIDIVDRCIRNAELSKEDIGKVILAGGSTRIPKIQELLSKYFNGKHLIKTLHPEECVAKGAALQAAMWSKSLKQDITMIQTTEVTASSLGVADLSNRMNVVIKKNTQIPTKKSVKHATVLNKQQSINIAIYEGERKDVRKNVCLGEFKITDLTPAPPGQCKIRITMSIDGNGILTVTAKERSKDNVRNLQIVYSKVIRVDALPPRNSDDVQSRLEDKRFEKFAEMYEFTMTYITAVVYNFNTEQILETDKYVLQRCHELYEQIEKAKISDDYKLLEKLGAQLIRICDPIVEKYNFKNMPFSNNVEQKFRNLSLHD